MSPTNTPQIYWVSEPLQPGETAMVAWAQPTQQGAAHNVTIFGRPAGGKSWVALETRGATEAGASAVIPTSFPAGREFSLRVGADGPPFTANRARPWFVFGDAGSYSTMGGHVRVVGDAIALGNASAVTTAQLHVTVSSLSQSTKVLTLPARSDPAGVNGTKPTRSHAFFDLPVSLPPGRYPVSKRTLSSHLYINAIFLPRQARDKRRETSKKDYRFLRSACPTALNVPPPRSAPLCARLRNASARSKSRRPHAGASESSP